MAVETTTTITGPLPTNGTTTVFNFTFQAMSPGEVDVFAFNGTNAAALPSFVVALADVGGTVTFSTPPASGLSLYIASDPDFRQQISFDRGSRWLPDPINEGLDRSAARSLWLRERVGSLSSPALLVPSLRAGKVMAWDADGVPFPSFGTGADIGLRLDLASAVTPGASLVTMKGEGAGATSRSVQRFLQNHVIHLADYYDGTLASGVDITSALQKAINAAAARRTFTGGVGRVYVPAGYWFQLSATITIPSFVVVEGAGKVETYLRRTGNYGHTFVVGTASPTANVQCAGIRNMAIFHDHGGGTVPSTNPASWTNAVTGAPAHIVAYTPVGCIFENLNLYCLPFQFICQGGAQSIFRNIDTYGVWDDQNTVMQEGLAGFLMAGDTAVTGSIPTWHVIEFCRFGGMTRAGDAVTYFGSHTKTTVHNIGPQNGLVFWMAESIVVSNCYTGACNSNGILVSGKSTDIISGLFISSHFFDPCGVKYQDACLKFENRDTGGIVDGVTVASPQFKGQQNGWRAISDWGSTATYGSVKDLIVTGGQATVFVGNPVELSNVRRARIDMNISAYNCENYYAGNPDQACAVHIGSGSINVVVSGYLGGGVYGEVAAGPNNRCVDGVRADAPVASRVTNQAISAGLSGTL